MKSIKGYIAIIINAIVIISIYLLPTYTREFKHQWSSTYTISNNSWYGRVDGTGLASLSIFPVIVTVFFIISCFVIVISKKKSLTLIAQSISTVAYFLANLITVSQMRNNNEDHNYWNQYMYIILFLLLIALLLLLFSRATGFVVEKDIVINHLEKKVDISTIKQYQELLNEGIITQEEFDKKRKELLDI